MLYYENNQYYISELKVHYIDEHEGEITKFVGQEGKQWWVDFSEKWQDTFKLKGFEAKRATKEQLERLNKINAIHLPEGVTLINEYVINDDLSQVQKGHPLYELKLEENLIQTQKLAIDLQRQVILGGV